MFRKLCLILTCAAALLFAGVDTARACPNCKEGIKTDNRMPMAYQYSIIFMLTIPATIFTGFGYTFYRLSQRNAARQRSLDPEVLAQYDARVMSALDNDRRETDVAENDKEQA